MKKRNTQKRRQLILQSAHSLGEVSVEGLAEEHSTSEVTIRKDLAALEHAGLVLRRYGGAIPAPVDQSEGGSASDPSKRKLAIALEAAKLIREHNRIIIDSGSTTRALIPHLSDIQGLVVMTNSISVANQLRELENEPSLLMTGGTWDKRSESFQGLLAEKMLREYDFDQLFIGADGLDIDRGTTTYNEFFALSRTMAEVSREVIVMAESAKLQRRIPNLEIAWSGIDTLVTDAELSDQQTSKIKQNGVKVIRAKYK